MVLVLQGTNMTELQEAILLTAELADCRGDEAGTPRGVILETKTRPGLGYVLGSFFLLLFIYLFFPALQQVPCPVFNSTRERCSEVFVQT